MGVSEKYAGKKPLTSETLQRMQDLGPLCERHGLRFAYVFGSAARDTTTITLCHDIDLAVMPGDTFSFRAFYADVSQLLRTDRLDIVDMRHAPISLLLNIVSGTPLLYCATGEDPLAFERGVCSKFRDMVVWSHQRERCLKERLAR